MVNNVKRDATQGQVSPFRAGSPHYVGFHGDRIIKPSASKVPSNPRRGGNNQDPQGGNPAHQGGKGVIGLTDEDIKKIEESYKESRKATPCPEPSIVIEVDNEFGNMLIKVGDKAPRKSSEGMAFVTIGVDENGEVAYISIEPEDEELARFIQRIRVR